jgi:hypothetical protein
LRAQTGITVRVTTDKNRILIGEPLQLTLEINYATGSVINLPAIDSVAHFEVLGKPLIDTSAGNAISSLKAIYSITSFDSGQWVIPSFNIAVGIHTDSIPVDVVFAAFNPQQPYHDITDVLDVPEKKKQEPWWWYAAGAVLLALVLYYVFRKQKPAIKPPLIPQQPVNAFEEAMRQLGLLAKQQITAREYYSALTDIFRLYIFRRKGILSLQKTTDDLVVQLKSLGLDKERFDKLSQALRMSDFVKFAKYIPAPADNDNCFEEIKQSVMAIEQIERDNIAAAKNNRP